METLRLGDLSENVKFAYSYSFVFFCEAYEIGIKLFTTNVIKMRFNITMANLFYNVSFIPILASWPYLA